MITIKSFDGGEFDGYLACRRVVMDQASSCSRRSLASTVHAQCADWYAAHGFVALCPDLFWRIERGIELTTKATTGKSHRALSDDRRSEGGRRLGAALEFLRKHPACSGRAGAVGFCMGGNLAYLLSARFKPDCALVTTASASRSLSMKRRT
jgi:carboxymethylenebutenolidase